MCNYNCDEILLQQVIFLFTDQILELENTHFISLTDGVIEPQEI